jgi:putative flippase GtrA
VSRPSLTRCWPAAADALGDQPRTPVDEDRDAALRAVDRLRQDDTLAQLSRFVLVGATSTALYAVLFLSLQGVGLGYLPAHIGATVASSVFANEMHRRLTFHAERRVSWQTAQIEAGSVSFIGLAATSAALGWLDAATGSVHPAVQITLVAAVTALIGLIRFIALRWIFRPTVPRTT